MTKRKDEKQEGGWRDLGQLNHKCLICREYPEDSSQHRELVDFLNTPKVERRGVRWNTFVMLYLRETLGCSGSASTWQRHVDECLERREDR